MPTKRFIALYSKRVEHQEPRSHKTACWMLARDLLHVSSRASFGDSGYIFIRNAPIVRTWADILGRVSGFVFRLQAEAEEQERLAKDLREKIEAKMASQSKVMKSLSEEAATLRSELKSLTEETKARFPLPNSSIRLELT